MEVEGVVAAFSADAGDSASAERAGTETPSTSWRVTESFLFDGGLVVLGAGTQGCSDAAEFPVSAFGGGLHFFGV